MNYPLLLVDIVKKATWVEILSIRDYIVVVVAVILPGCRNNIRGGIKIYQSYYSINRERSAFKCCCYV